MPLSKALLFQASVDALGFFGGGDLGAGLESLECGVEDGHLAAASYELGGELCELGVEVCAELVDGLFESVIGGDLFGLTDFDGFEIGEDGVEEQVVQGVDSVIHEQIVWGS